MKNRSSNKFLLTLITTIFLLGTLAITLQASKKNVNPQVRANPESASCSAVPAGTYNIRVKTYLGIPWNILCPWKNGNWSGTIPAGEIMIGRQSVPRINSGASYSFSTTLRKICDSGLSASNWKQICLTCKYIDCSKVKVTGSGMASQIQCSLGAYTASGNGKLNVSYNGGLLGSCSAKASYNGKIMGSFMVTK